MSKQMQNKTKLSNHRAGVTLVEVLFAMMIALFGLAGILAIMPLASRRAADSYTLNHASTGAFSSVAAASATKLMQPSDDSPWLIDDDLAAASPAWITPDYPPLNNYPHANGEPYKAVRSLSDVYSGLYLKALAGNGINYNSSNAAEVLQKRRVWRQILGQGFCVDPLYFAEVNATQLGTSWAGQATFLPNSYLFRRTRMPFYSEFLTIDASNSFVVSGGLVTPRLIRVSKIANAQRYSTGGSAPYAPSPLKKIAAEQLMASFGDIIQATAQEDKSYGALREFEGTDALNPQLLTQGSRQDLSFLVTLVPRIEQDDPVESDIIGNPLYAPSEFIATIVVLNKREPNYESLLTPAATPEEFPEGESVAFALNGATATGPVDFAAQPVSSGSLLNVRLYSDAATSPNLRVGSYVMLSRYAFINLPDSFDNTGTLLNGSVQAHQHKWYRIAAVQKKESWGPIPASSFTTAQPAGIGVMLEGPAWDYPDQTDINQPFLNPLDPAANRTVGRVPSPTSAEVRTIATIMPNAVAVYQIPIRLDAEETRLNLVRP